MQMAQPAGWRVLLPVLRPHMSRKVVPHQNLIPLLSALTVPAHLDRQQLLKANTCHKFHATSVQLDALPGLRAIP